MIRGAIVIGLDGFDPRITEALLAAGELPNLARLRDAGGYRRLATTYPAQTPVAWSTFATGLNPGGHGIFDFLRRNPATYQPEMALFQFEQKRSFLPPRIVNLRGGTPVWERLADAGIPAVVLRHPCTYPPDRIRGRMLGGVGVPDLRGGFGTGTFYTTDAHTAAREGERVVVMKPAPHGAFESHIVGPRDPGTGEDERLPFVLEPSEDGAGASLRLHGTGVAVELQEGEWSDWARVRFRLGFLQSVHGLVRFLLVSTTPLRVYASPIGFDPLIPPFPISRPWDYAAELEREIGTFHTLGMPEEHNALNNGRIDEAAFLQQCGHVVAERRAMLRYELNRFEEGLLFCLFDTPDRIQHMFWRYRDPDHPAHRDSPPVADMSRVIEDHYRECDEIIGEVLEYAGDDTLVLVLSDHGFTDFQREIHLNAWLHQHGLLALKPGATPGAAGLSEIDWSRTRAYALGLAGIYLNLRGREAEGIVSADDAEDVKRGIAGGLAGHRDSALGAVAIRSVLRREDVYTCEHLEDAPDLIINTASGYRVSSMTALGGVGDEQFGDNRKRWSGDHVVDPELVPGVLFSNRRIEREHPRLVDLAPTLLAVLGAPTDPAAEGQPLVGSRQ